MFIVKLSIGVLCVILCLLVAKNRANYIKDKYYYFSSLVNSCELIKSDLIYKKRSIKEILSVDFQSLDFNQTIKSYFNSDEFFPKYLNIEEKVLVKDYFKALGKGDTNSQLSIISSFKEEFLKIASDSKREFDKSYKVTIKVGFSIGIMLFVLVI